MRTPQPWVEYVILDKRATLEYSLPPPRKLFFIENHSVREEMEKEERKCRKKDT